MKKIVLNLSMALMLPLTLLAQKKEFSVYFDYKQEALTEQHKSIIASQLAALELKPDEYFITLKGYTDNVGSPAYNKKLAVRRTMGVKQLLLNQGFKNKDIDLLGLGASIPLASNDTEEGRAKNRRVVVTLSEKSQAFREHPVNANVQGKVVKGDAGKEIRFTHPSGTEIVIPANSLVDQNGKPIEGEVEIEYTEYKDHAEVFSSGLPMMHNGDAFASAGMFEIRANQNGQPVDVAPGKSIEMDFAMGATDYDYNFYVLNEETGNWEERNELSGGTWSGDNIKTKRFKQLVDPGVVKYRCKDVRFEPETLLEKAKLAVDSSINSYPVFGAQEFIYFDDRYNSHDYTGTRLKKDIAELPIIVKNKGKAGKGDIILELQDQSGEHTEFETLKKSKILLDPYLNDVTQLTSRRWADARIKYDEKENIMELELKADTSFTVVQIKADVDLKMNLDKVLDETEKLYYGDQVQLDRAVIEEKQKNAKFYNSYIEVLRERRAAFDFPIREKETQYNNARRWLELSMCDRRDCFWNFMRAYATDEEILEGKFKWFKFAFDNRPMIKRRLDSLMLVYENDLEGAREHRLLLDREAYWKEMTARTGWEKQPYEEAGQKSTNEDYSSVTVSNRKSFYPKKEVASVSIKLPSFGIFNGDYPINVRLMAKDKEKVIRDPKELIVDKYKTADGEQIYPQVAYLFPGDYVGNIRMDGHNGLTPYKFPYNTLVNNRLLLIDAEGNKYTFDHFDQIDNKAPAVLKVNETATPMNTIEEVKQEILPQLY